MKKYLPHPYSALTAALAILAMPPYDFWPLVYVALIPYLILVDRSASWKEALRHALWVSAIGVTVGCHYLAGSIHDFAQVPLPVAALALVLYSPFAQPQWLAFALSFFFYRQAQRERTRARFEITAGIHVLFLGLLYAGLDGLLPKIFKDTLGQAFHTQNTMVQIADTIGIWGLTWLVAISNIALWRAFTLLKEPQASLRIVSTLLPTAATLLFVYSYGQDARIQIRRMIESPDQEAWVAAIQPHVHHLQKLSAEKRGAEENVRAVLSQLFSLTDQAQEQAKEKGVRLSFIVWPETAYPLAYGQPRSPFEDATDRSIVEAVKKSGVPWVIGSYRHLGGKDYNSIFFLDIQGDSQVYSKSILMPFGEEIPYFGDTAIIQKLLPELGNFGKGSGPDVITLKNPQGGLLDLGPVVCYETLFTDHFAQTWRKGAQFILNLTNDSWFGSTGAQEIHMSLAKIRSVEVRMTQLRSTNNGITAIILPDGTLRASIPKDEAAVLLSSVPIVKKRTASFVALQGDWFPSFAFWMGLIPILSAAMTLLKRRRAKVSTLDFPTTPSQGWESS